MKKKFLFLFTASALLAACSSDEIVNENPGTNEPETPVTEETVASSVSYTTEEGIGMSIGALDDAAITKAEEYKEVYFDLVLPDDVLKNWDNYYIKPDDFAIRINGDYLNIHINEENTEASFSKLKLSRAEKLKVRASGLNGKYAPESSTTPTNIAFEVYLWIENKKALDDGSGSYGELFDDDDKLAWIDNNTEEKGTDITKNCTVGLHDKSLENEGKPEYGYAVRYNAYRGISGRPVDENGKFDEDGLGDTPYIKVSIAVDQVGDKIKTSVAGVYPSSNEEEKK